MPVFSSIRKRRKRLKCNENISNMFACGSRAFFFSGGEGWGVIPRFNVFLGIQAISDIILFSYFLEHFQDLTVLRINSIQVQPSLLSSAQ